jgi:membrane protein
MEVVRAARETLVDAYRWCERVARQRIAPTSPWRAHERYSAARGSWLAASITYYGFLSLFPLIAVSATVVAATLGSAEIHRIEAQLRQNLPGIADRLPIDAMLVHAGTVGVIGALVLLYSGLGWVAATRAAVRTMWGVYDEPGNIFVRKLADVGSLVGLGLAMALSLAATTLATGVASQVLHWLGLRDTTGAGVLLGAIGIALGIGLGLVLFGYLLSGIARIRVPRRRLLAGAFAGALGFEALKLGIGTYLEHVATKNVYGVFGTPIALLIWINLVARLLLYCAAWTAVKAERPAAMLTLPNGARDRVGVGVERQGGVEPPRAPEGAWPTPKPRYPARPRTGSTRATRAEVDARVAAGRGRWRRAIRSRRR